MRRRYRDLHDAEGPEPGVQDREACPQLPALLAYRINRYCIIRWIAGSIRTTACRERMIELNNTNQLETAEHGYGTFRQMAGELARLELEPQPLLGYSVTDLAYEDGSEEECIGSVVELFGEIEKSVKARLYGV